MQQLISQINFIFGMFNLHESKCNPIIGFAEYKS